MLKIAHFVLFVLGVSFSTGTELGTNLHTFGVLMVCVAFGFVLDRVYS